MISLSEGAEFCTVFLLNGTALAIKCLYIFEPVDANGYLPSVRSRSKKSEASAGRLNEYPCIDRLEAILYSLLAPQPQCGYHTGELCLEFAPEGGDCVNLRHAKILSRDVDSLLAVVETLKSHSFDANSQQSRHLAVLARGVLPLVDTVQSNAPELLNRGELRYPQNNK